MATNNDSGDKKSTSKALWIALILIAILLLSWHFILPALGIAAVATVGVVAGAWGIAIAMIVLLCVGGLLFFIFTGIGIMIISILAVVGVIIAIILSPVLFPLLVPILILLLFIGFIRKRKRNKD